jgi:hypothetical protein
VGAIRIPRYAVHSRGKMLCNTLLPVGKKIASFRKYRDPIG